MKIPGELTEAVLIKRLTRFTADVAVGEKIHRVHVPNSGRLTELLFPGNRIILRKADENDTSRKTLYTIIQAYEGKQLVSIESARANHLFAEAIRRGILEDFSGYTIRKPEVKIGSSRIDFLLESNQGIQTLVEVKSVTLIRNRQALFPDAPTTRGRRHVIELSNWHTPKTPARIVFVIQREDADFFTPNYRTDPEFGKSLELAEHTGVEILAYRCRIFPQEQIITEKIPVILKTPVNTGINTNF